MKSLSIATLLMALCATQASAASLSVDQVGNVFSLYLNGFGFNGSFNAIQATITPAAPSTFSNINSGLNGLVPRSPGEPFTFRSRTLDQAVVDGGLGWTILGVTVSPALVEFSGGPLGQQIDTSGQPGGRLFLGNVVLPPSGSATASVLMAGNGQTLATLSTTFATGNVPEPATCGLLLLGMVGITAVRRGRN